MSLWIRKLADGTLVVPLASMHKGVKLDGVATIKPGDKDYAKYLNLYNQEQKRKPDDS